MYRSWLTLENASRFLAGLALFLVLYWIAAPEHLNNYRLFHSLAEMFSVAVALAIFMVFWNSRQFLHQGFFLVVGVASLFVGGIDLLHALAYKGMQIFLDADENLPTQLWIAARYLQGFSLLAAALLIRRRVRTWPLVVLYTTVTLVLLATIFHWKVFPDCFLPGVGQTAFKKVSEYGISLTMVGSILILWRRRREFDPDIARLLAASIGVTIVSELTFTSYVNVYGLSNLVGHFLKILAVYLMYKALIEVALTKPYRVVFRQLKQREEDLQTAKDAAEEASRAKSRFLANVSHELRTPMNAILGMTQLAMEEDLAPTVREYLETVKESADNLLALLNEVLDCARIESGKVILESAPFSLRATLGEVVRPLAVRAFEKGLELVCDVAPGTPDRFVGDPLRLRQVLTNLVGNAIKFTAAGEVVLRAEPCDPAGDGPGLRMAVSDTGIGISPGDQEKIFAPFAQADASTARLYGGTGLGLTISSSLVAMMGGRLAVQSEPGRGSTFWFTLRLPQSPEHAADEPVDRAGIAQLRGGTVLVVDDNATNRQMIQRMLTARSLESETASEVTGALSLLSGAASREKTAALLIVDGGMPGVEALLAHAREDAGRPAVPVILSVSPTERQTLAKRVQGQEIVYLEKPVLEAGLLRAIARAMGIAREAEQPPSTLPAPAPRVARPLHVLLVEDTPANQKLVVRILGKRGHTVDVASDGHEAVALVRQKRFDLVLMDVQMPGMDGFEATAAIRSLADRTKAEVLVIAMTAHAMKGDDQRCLAAGMDAYLAKPIDSRQLIETVETLAARTAHS